MIRQKIRPVSLQIKKKVMRFFTLSRIDIGDPDGEFIYDNFDKLRRFSLFIDNPKGKYGYFLGLRYRRKAMLVAYFHFVTDQYCGLYVNGVDNVGWAKKQKKDLEKKFQIKIDIACLSVKPIFKKRKLDFFRLKKM